LSLDLRPFTVFGYWSETLERWCDTFQATSPRNAEDQAQLAAADAGGTLRVCRVADGDLAAADTYTAFLDPADPRNEDRDDLEPDMADATLGMDPYWTVFGLAVPEGCEPASPGIAAQGERYGDIVSASSPGAAEDVARDRLHDRHGALLVCAVVPGQVHGADAYAIFCDPDVRAA
jgi:hypothetical protein